MQISAAQELLPVISNEKKVDISLKNNQVVIKFSTWAEDLGWCGQKTMSFEAEMLDDLHHIITKARFNLKRQKAKDQEEMVFAKILPFPQLS